MSGIRAWLALFCWLVVAAVPQTARAAWNEARSNHFVVYSNGGSKQLREFAERLEKFDYLLRVMSGTDVDRIDRPLKVFALDNESEVKSIRHDPNVAGFYSTSDRSAFAIVSRLSSSGKFDLSAEQLLFHEYAHHFMLHYFPAAYPAWYVEGFAEFYATVDFKQDGSIVFGKVPMYRAPTLVLMGIYPLERLFARDTEELGRKEGDSYYGTAWLLTHYFRYHDKRQAEFNKYLKDVTTGVPDVTLENHFEGGAKALEKELRDYIKGRKMMMSSLTPEELPAIDVNIIPMDEAHSAMLKYELRMMARMPEAEHAKFAADAGVAAAKFPNSAYAQALLAEALLLAGRKDEAFAAADRAIALDPQFAPALGTKASLLLERANDSDKAEDWKAALSTIVKANRADLEDPVPLALFYRYHAMRGGEMPPVGYQGLEKAFVLLPQNPSYRFMLASAYAHKKDFKSAAAVMDAIAFSPHASEMRDAAQKMQAAFRKAEKDGSTVPLETEAPEKTGGN